MAEDMRVLEGMLADGGLEASSEDVEAYKYTYRYHLLIQLLNKHKSNDKLILIALGTVVNGQAA